VSAQLAKVPISEDVTDARLPDLLDHFDARQVFHVTFGSALDRFGDRIQATLRASEEMYSEGLETHFERHLSPFVV
jgi:hypothetical protein